MTQMMMLPIVPGHVEMLLDSSEKRIPEGHRLVTVWWKLTEKQKAADPAKKARPSVCTVIPQIAVKVVPELLQTALSRAVEDMQDQIVSEVVNKAILADSSITLTSIRIDLATLTERGIADWHAQKAVSGRLSKDAIGNWFDTVMLSELQIRFAPMPGMTEELLPRVMQDYRNKFCDLASPRAMMPEALAVQLQKALDVLETSDKVKETLAAKLQSFIKPPEVTTMAFYL